MIFSLPFNAGNRVDVKWDYVMSDSGPVSAAAEKVETQRSPSVCVSMCRFLCVYLSLCVYSNCMCMSARLSVLPDITLM